MADQVALRCEQITKRYRRGALAVDRLNLYVQAGQIYGFLGQNGAGKTTTIKMLLDLVQPTGGTIYLYGMDPRRQRTVLRRVGSLVEGATFYPYLSGRGNLELLRRMNGGKSIAINALLERVGLAEHGDQRFGSYSTGMKQRLGIAAALLHDPDLVILDEPTDGLDPVGLVTIRELIRALVDHEGKTVFLSSHLLTEVEQLCTRIAIIDKGRLIQEGTIHELLQDHREIALIGVDDVEMTISVLCPQWPTTASHGSNKVQVYVKRGEIPEVVRRLVAHQIAVFEVTPQHQSLEELFLSLVAKGA